MRDHQPLDLAVLAEHVDRAPVGEPRNHEAGQTGERPLIGHRRREQLARLGDERGPLSSGALGLVEPRPLEREGRLAREGDLHLPASLAEIHVLAEREADHADDTTLERERQDGQGVSVLAPPAKHGEELVPLVLRAEEERLPGPGDVRHRQLCGDREPSPFPQHGLVVAALGEQLDGLAVLAHDADRPGPRLCGAQPLSQHRVEDLLRGQRLCQTLADALETVGAIGGVGKRFRAHVFALSPDDVHETETTGRRCMALTWPRRDCTCVQPGSMGPGLESET